MKEYERLLDRMKNLSDEELQKMVYVEFDDYTDVALEAAREVIRERGIERSMVEQENHDERLDHLRIFKDYLLAADPQVVESKLFNLFKENDETVAKIMGSYGELSELEPNEMEDVFIFIAQTKSDFSFGYPFDVFGIEFGQTEYFSLELFAWQDFLGLPLFERSHDFILKLGIDEFVAMALKKLTTHGYTFDEVEAKISEIMNSTVGFDLYDEVEAEDEEA